MKNSSKFLSIVLTMLAVLIFVTLRHYNQSQAMITPLAKTQPTPTPLIIEVHEGGGDEIIDEISRVFKKEGTKVVAKAIACFNSESGLNTLAYGWNEWNKTADVGIAQINDVHGMSIEDRQDYRKNIAKAYKLYLENKRSFKAPKWFGTGCQ